MSQVVIYSKFGETICKPFMINKDEDCLSEDEKINLPLPDPE